ncbi:beta/gamma crystallin-related protein [Maricaulis sp.]|uniref:beta/gamma crystallin-related protein n=1 Tax=Maricaulis sp. TaxID=1486257 RepID=UPI00260BF6F1|nr:beta/gamma crystallin-related protein [Maricaulis sp.]
MSLFRIAIGGIALAAAQAFSASAQEAILYEHDNFQGRSIRITADTPNLDRTGMNDRVSSIRIISGTWEFCQHSNYRGSCFTANNDRRSLPGFNDTMSSARPAGVWRDDRRGHDRGGHWDDHRDRDDRWDNRRGRRDRGGRGSRGGGRGPAEITLYSGPNFTGRSITLHGPADNLRSYNFNDTARSIRIQGRGSWQICQHANYGGACMQIREDRPYLGGGMAGEVSSASPDYNSNRRGTRPREGVWLFDARDFRGQRFEAVYDIPNLDHRRFNDRADSIVVARGETWEVCEHANYRGRCEVVDSESLSDLGRYGFHNRISSLRRIDGYGRW